jgi:endoglucanase
MLAWHANVTRLPLNEDCWIGTKTGLNPTYSGVNHQNAMKTFVNLANASGFIAEVDLHFGSGTASLAKTGEMGFQGSCASAKINQLKTPQFGYWAWSWNPLGCTSGPSLIKHPDHPS